jgi:hypothetical protein
MSLSIKAIDRLFERLGATYGAQWHRVWDGVPMADVKTLWAQELAGYENNLEPIVWALENLPERAPNVIVFKNLCRSAPAHEVVQLPEPKADPERVKAELEKLGQVKSAARANLVGQKDWARRIVARHEAGEILNPICLRFARQALRNELRKEAAV